MASYTCKKCGKKVNISIYDPVYDLCPDCNLVIASGNYEQNVTGGTWFSSFGENLGHQIMGEVILRYYREQNPSEVIIILKKNETRDVSRNGILTNAINKLFWADVTPTKPTKDIRLINYRFSREVAALADKGYYPQYHTKSKIDYIDTSEKFYVLHLRNITTNTPKNVSQYDAEIILKLFDDENVYIVGNDLPFYDLEKPYDFINLRGKLDLSQIAWLCGHDNCIATISKDSGIAHLAAAAGGRVVSYGYASESQWVPSAPPGQVKAFGRTAGEFDKFINYIKNEFYL